MTSLREIIETTRHSLSGFDSNREAVRELATTVNSSALSIEVDDVGAQSGVNKGFIEIDLEQIRVKEIDASSTALVAFTFGRGYRGTTAAAHTAGAEVRINPSWPMSTIAREINGVISDIYPSLYVVDSTETTFPTESGAITVPADATGIIAVYVQDELRTGQWVREDRWSWQPDSSSTNKGLRVGGSYRSGLGIRVVYAKRPAPFDLAGALTQDFETVTGLPAGFADVIRLGVAARMAPFFDVARLPSTSAVARFDGESRGPSAGTNVTRILDAQFQRRLQQEAAALDSEHPIRVHFTGRV